MTGNRVVRVLALLAAVVAAACDSSSSMAPRTPPAPKPVAVVDVTAPQATLQVGAQMTLVATPKAANGDTLSRSVTWSSENQQVATVSNVGVVTAVAPGSVNIVATSESRTGAATILVTAIPDVPPAAVAQVRLSVDDEVLLEWNGTQQLSAVALDALGNELPGRAVQWHSSKPLVATVTNSGSVHAVGPGTSTITAVIEGMPSSVGVRVSRAPVTDVILDIPAGGTALEVGETVFVGTRVKLASGQIIESPLTWTSSHPATATASSSNALAAAVQALGAGETTLTGSVEGKSASIYLRITPRPTHDLIYNRWDAENKSEILVLSLGGAGSAPVKINAGNVSRDPSPSPDGTQLVFAVSQIDAQGNDQNDLYIVNRNGMNMRRLTSAPGMELEPTWSPDGTKILFRVIDSDDTGSSLWTVNVDGTDLTKLTTALPVGVRDPRNPAWSPDGTRIAFTAARDAQHKIWTMNSDGSNATQLTTDAGFDVSPTWSPDGTRIAFSRYNTAVPSNGWDVAIVSSGMAGAPVRLALSGDQHTPVWSPDGHYIAVSGTVVAGQGTQNIYTLRPDGTGLRLRTTNAAWLGGTAPAWISRQ